MSLNESKMENKKESKVDIKFEIDLYEGTVCRISTIDNLHISIEPTRLPFNVQTSTNWLVAVQHIICMALTEKPVKIVSNQPLEDIIENDNLSHFHQQKWALDEVKVNGTKYFVSSCDKLSSTICKDLVESQEFELSLLFFFAVSDDKIFYMDLEKVDKNATFISLPGVAGELLHMTGDGHLLLWYNPSSGVDAALTSIRSTCSE